VAEAAAAAAPGSGDNLPVAGEPVQHGGVQQQPGNVALTTGATDGSVHGQPHHGAATGPDIALVADEGVNVAGGGGADADGAIGAGNADPAAEALLEDTDALALRKALVNGWASEGRRVCGIERDEWVVFRRLQCRRCMHRLGRDCAGAGAAAGTAMSGRAAHGLLPARELILFAPIRVHQ